MMTITIIQKSFNLYDVPGTNDYHYFLPNEITRLLETYCQFIDDY